MVLSIASKQLKMTAAEAISGATINAAHALRIDRRTGSLEFGKDADLIMLNVADYREISYYSGVNLVSMTMRRGELLYREAEVNWLGK
jgi:imidazolonepropionase